MSTGYGATVRPDLPGAKALAKAVKSCFGQAVWIQRCRVHSVDTRSGTGSSSAGSWTLGPDDFGLSQLQCLCPGVSVDMIRHVLKSQREQNKVECLGRGRNAPWRRTRKQVMGR